MVSEESCGCDFKSTCLLASCLYFSLPVSCKTLEVQGNQALSQLISLKDKPDNYPLDQWLLNMQHVSVDINITSWRRMTAPKDIISYTQNHCLFFFKEWYIFKLLHFCFLLTQMLTCWARGWVARKVMKCSFFQMVLLYCGWYGAVTENTMSWAAGSSAFSTEELLLYARSCLQRGSWLCSVAGDFHLAAWSMLYCTGCVLGMQVSFCICVHCLLVIR